jgi:HEAT repeat protein
MRFHLRWTRRKTVAAATLALLIAAGAMAAREWSFVNHLPMEVRHRMPWHCTVPSGLDPDVRAGIEGLYAADAHDRTKAAHDLACLGPEAAPAVPYLAALLADYPFFTDSVTRQVSSRSPWRDRPIIGPIVRFFSWDSEEKDNLGSDTAACEALSQIGPPAVEPLIAALHDDEGNARLLAAVALGNIADERAIDPLAAAMNDPEGPALQTAAAAVALAQFRNERAVRHLRDALIQDGRPANPYLETVAAQALARLGPLGVPPLIEGAGMDSPDGTEPLWCLAMYVQDHKTLSDPACRRAAETLAAAVTDPDEQRSFAAVRGLKGFNEPFVIDALVAAAGNPMLKVRQAALEALAAIGGPKAVQIHTAALADPDLNLTATLGLARMGDPEALRVLSDRLLNPKDKDTDEIKRVVSESYGPRTAPVLREMLDRFIQQDRFDAVVRAFDDRHDAAALPILIEHARSLLRTAVLKGTLISYGPEAVPALVASLREPGENELVLDVLGQLKDPRAVEPLLEHLADPDPENRRDDISVLRALGEIGDRQAAEPLLEILSKPDLESAACVFTIYALGHMQDDRAVEPLIKMLGRSVEISTAAAQALGRLGDKRAIPALRVTLEDPSVSGPQTPTGPTSARSVYLWALLQLGDTEAIEPAFAWESGIGQDLRVFELYRKMGPPAVPPLVRLLHGPPPEYDDYGSRQRNTVRVLLFIGTPEALEAARPYFASRDSFVFKNLANDCTCMGAYPPTSSLLALLTEHKDLQVRRDAAKLLALAKDPSAVPALRAAAAGDPCGSVRVAAWDAIEKLTGETRPASVPPRWLDERALQDIPGPPG